jgi:hypothetical protein
MRHIEIELEITKHFLLPNTLTTLGIELETFFLKGGTKCHSSTHKHSCGGSHYVPRTLQMQHSWESTFVEFCVDGINLYDENNFIGSLGLGRDSNPDPSALKPSECTTTQLTSS